MRRCKTNLRNRFGPRMFKKAMSYCQQIRQEIRELSAYPPASDFQTPPLQKILPQESAIVAVPSPSVEALAITESLTATTIYEPPASVLLVEDNAINLKLLVTCVKKMNFDYITATDGAEAVDKYRRFPGKIPLIFMDIQMPVMNGTEATQRIRQHERDNLLPRACIVALTALSSEEAKHLALDCGVDLFLTKPVPFKHLTTLLKDYCKPPR